MKFPLSIIFGRNKQEKRKKQETVPVQDYPVDSVGTFNPLYFGAGVLAGTVLNDNQPDPQPEPDTSYPPVDINDNIPPAPEPSYDPPQYDSTPTYDHSDYTSPSYDSGSGSDFGGSDGGSY